MSQLYERMEAGVSVAGAPGATPLQLNTDGCSVLDHRPWSPASHAAIKDKMEKREMKRGAVREEKMEKGKRERQKYVKDSTRRDRKRRETRAKRRETREKRRER